MKGGTVARAWSLKRHLKRASSVFLRTHQWSAAARRAPFHLREQNIHDPLRALTQSQADRNNCSVCLSLFGARFFFVCFFLSFTPSLLIFFFTACKDVRVWCNVGCHSMSNGVSVCDLNSFFSPPSNTLYWWRGQTEDHLWGISCKACSGLPLRWNAWFITQALRAICCLMEYKLLRSTHSWRSSIMQLRPHYCLITPARQGEGLIAALVRPGVFLAIEVWRFNA